MTSISRSHIRDRLSRTLLRLAMSLVIVFSTLSGLSCAARGTAYVRDSRKIEILEPNEPAPHRGILITQGYFEYLLECEGETVE